MACARSAADAAACASPTRDPASRGLPAARSRSGARSAQVNSMPCRMTFDIVKETDVYAHTADPHRFPRCLSRADQWLGSACESRGCCEGARHAGPGCSSTRTSPAGEAVEACVYPSGGCSSHAGLGGRELRRTCVSPRWRNGAAPRTPLSVPSLSRIDWTTTRGGAGRSKPVRPSSTPIVLRAPRRAGDERRSDRGRKHKQTKLYAWGQHCVYLLSVDRQLVSRSRSESCRLL